MLTGVDPTGYLSDELKRLDLLIHREILRMRARYNLSLDEFRGLYISDEQVDSYVRAQGNQEGAEESVEMLSARVNALRAVSAGRSAAYTPFGRLAQEFGLVSFEIDVLLLALAPELDLKYETFYAYLNNDVGRKWPSCDLALRLFADEMDERTKLRRYLLPGATLFREGLLVHIERPSYSSSRLSAGFFISQAVAAFVLGLPVSGTMGGSFRAIESGLPKWDSAPVSEELMGEISRASVFFDEGTSKHSAPLLIFEGRPGSGRNAAAVALCRQLGVPFIQFDLNEVRAGGGLQPLAARMADLTLCARLERSGVYITGVETLFGPEDTVSAEAHLLALQLAKLPGPVFIACSPGTPWRQLFKGQRCVTYCFHDPNYLQRQRIWRGQVAQAGAIVHDDTLDSVASRFVLTPGQIHAAVDAALDAQFLNGEPGEPMALDTLLEAARAQADSGLGGLAAKVVSSHTWDDLVLPPATLCQAREIASAIKYHELIYSQWGFSRRITSGRGLKVLFAGASGTGKTMTAGVIARDLGLDLNKIDLSGVVSKYIGETEKNLDRIFRAARFGNAILFFDEADALFGKRSEVKDAHDRYANIEVSYLLQKLEEHEGAVILASNLRHNIDDAFSRRMHYVVEFPLPDEEQRERLWRGMFPALAPLAPDVDFSFLALQFPIAGGDIQNAALNAAFLAVADGRVVTMTHLVRAMARQMLKNGRVPSVSEFGEYHHLVGM